MQCATEALLKRVQTFPRIMFLHGHTAGLQRIAATEAYFCKLPLIYTVIAHMIVQ